MALRSFVRFAAALGLSLTSVNVFLTTELSAETKAEKLAQSQELVKEALHREVFGLESDRQRLLGEALKLTPNLPAAQWHLGRIEFEGKWVTVEEFGAKAQANTKLEQYRRLRERTANDLAGNIAMARYCAKNDLKEQERAHLSRVVELEPQNLEARRRLGHVRVGGEWQTPAQLSARQQETTAARKALTKWRPTIAEIKTGLLRRSEKQRAVARDRLLAIHDPMAIGAIEEALLTGSEELSSAGIEAIGGMASFEAAIALARHAVVSPYAEVRALACEKLKSRPRESYVPSLLATLQSPLLTRSQIYRGAGGSLVLRQEVSREDQDSVNVSVRETEYNRVAQQGGDRNDTLARAMSDVQRTNLAGEVAADAENTRTMALNARVMEVLEESTGEIMPSTPETWWLWWNNENEVFVQGDKQLLTSYQRDQVSVVDRVPQSNQGDSRSSGGASSGMSIAQFSGDCLAAGTKVWTESGPLAIEEIRVGDRVLSQNPRSGELAFKVVLGTTIRPASQLVRIEAGQEQLSTSGGHLYWASGEGWRKARELKSGDQLHGARCTVQVSSVAKSETAPTFNLIVEDFHSYFVGQSLILCHDNTIRQPVNAIVPGLLDY